MKIGGLRHPQLKLLKSLTVEYQQYATYCTLWNNELEEWGEGKDLGDAVEDFQQSIAALYFSLRASKDTLGPLMEQHWQYLCTIIEERT